jgi:integrase
MSEGHRGSPGARISASQRVQKVLPMLPATAVDGDLTTRPATAHQAVLRQGREAAAGGYPGRSAKLRQELAPASRYRELSAIKSLLAFGHRIGYLPFDVDRALRLPGVRNRLSERILPEAEVHRMLSLEPNERNRALLMLLYASPVRVSELCGLGRRDVQANGEGGHYYGFGKGTRTVQGAGLRLEVPRRTQRRCRRRRSRVPVAQIWCRTQDSGSTAHRSSAAMCSRGQGQGCQAQDASLS